MGIDTKKIEQIIEQRFPEERDASLCFERGDLTVSVRSDAGQVTEVSYEVREEIQEGECAVAVHGDEVIVRRFKEGEGDDRLYRLKGDKIRGMERLLTDDQGHVRGGEIREKEMNADLPLIKSACHLCDTLEDLEGFELKSPFED